MRRLGTTILLALGLSGALAAASAQASTTPLVRWAFETVGSTTPDLSGNNRDGSVTNVTQIADGRFGSGLTMSGNAAVAVPASTALEPASFSTMVWVRRLGTPTVAGPIVTYGQHLCANAPAYTLSVASGGNVQFAVRTATGTATAPDVDSSYHLWDGAWHLLTTTYDGSTAKVYVDDNQVSGASTGSGAINYGPAGHGGLQVGTANGAGCTRPTADVDVDEARLYDQPLTLLQVSNLGSLTNTAPPTVDGPNPSSQDPTFEYPFNGITPQNRLVDSSGHAVHGLSNTGSLDPAGRFGNGLRLSGTGDGFSSAPSRLLFNSYPTVLAWVRRTGAQPANESIIASNSFGCTNNFALQTSAGGGVEFTVRQFSSGTPVTTPAAAPAAVFDGNWHALVGVVRTTGVELWLDGTRVGTTAWPSGYTGASYSSGQQYDVGHDPNCSSRPSFNGVLDEVSAYPRPLAGDEIGFLSSQTATSPPQLPLPDFRLQWHLDGTGAAQPDTSGTGLDGTASATTAVTDGRFGTAQRVGAGGRISRPGSPLLEPNKVTFLEWVRHTGNPGSGTLAAYGSTACATSPSYGLTTAANGDLTFAVRTGASSSATATGPGDEIWDGRWHMVAGTYDGYNARLYLDGTRAGASPGASAAIDYPAGARSLSVGAPPPGCGASLGVDVDEVQVAGSEYGAGQLRSYARSFRTLPPSPTDQTPDPGNFGLIAQYHLNSIFNATTLDSSGNDSLGTSVAATLIADGRFQNAFHLAGAGQGFVTGSTYDYPYQVTAMAWVRGTSPGDGRIIMGVGDHSCAETAYGLETVTGGGVSFHAYHGDGNGNATRLETMPIPASQVWDGRWHAIAGSFGNNGLSLYLDGQQVSSSAPPTNPYLDYSHGYSGGLGVGRDPDVGCTGATRALVGDVDEVRLYDHALTAKEINYLQDPTPNEPSDLPAVTRPEREPDLALKWHLDAVDGTGEDGTVTDTSGNGFDAHVHGVDPLPSARFRAGLTVKGADPTQSSAAPVGAEHAGEETELKPDSVSVVTWVRGTNPGSDAVIATQGVATSTAGEGQCSGGAYALANRNGSPSFFVLRGGGAIPPSHIGSDAGSGVWDGQWHALVGVYDHTSVKLYVDGVPAGGGNPQTGPIDYADAPGGFRVGSAGDASCPGKTQLHGDVDEVRVYKRALTPAEIEYLSAGYHRVPPRLPMPVGPKNTTRPAVSGLPKVGVTDTCTPGTWTGSPTFQYLWERAPRSTRVDGDAAWAAIDGAAAQTYQVQPVDDGSRIRCRVIATENAMSTEAISKSLRVDSSVPTLTPVKQTDGTIGNNPPRITGDPIADHTLTCIHGDWDHGPDESDFSYQWLHDGQPIAGATQSTYKLQRRYDYYSDIYEDDPNGDGDRQVACRVIAANDVGPSAPATSVAVKAVDDPPYPKQVPKVTVDRAAHPNPLEQTATCNRGSYYFDYLGQPGYEDQYKWYRSNTTSYDDATEISGATSPTLKLTADMLGRYISCKIIPHNPAGYGTFRAESFFEFIPLPVGSTAGKMDVVYRHNRYYPVSMLATSDRYRLVAHNTFAQYQTDLLAGVADACATPQGRKNESQPPPTQIVQLPAFFFGGRGDYVVNIPLTPAQQCWVLNRPAQKVRVSNTGIGWSWSDNAKCDAATSQDSVEQETRYCRSFGIGVQPVDASTVDALPTDTAAHTQLVDTLRRTTPQAVLWDVDGDNRTDISCPGSSPVLRGNFDPGQFTPQAVIVNPAGNPDLPQFVTVKATFDFPDAAADKDTHGNTVHGAQRRPLQPMWCRNTMAQPPDPTLPPCTSTGTIGAVRLAGNLCPMDVRGIDDDALKGLPDNLQMLIKDAAKKVSDAERAKDLAQPGSSTGTRRRWAFQRATLPSAQDLQTAVAATNTGSALGTVGVAQAAAQAGGTALEQSIDGAIKDDKDLNAKIKAIQAASHAGDKKYVPPGVDVSKASFATDQLYTAAGTLSVNGVDIDPRNAKVPTLIVPSDVSSAIPELNIKKMTILSQDAIESLPSPKEAAQQAQKIVLNTAKEYADQAKAQAKQLVKTEVNEGLKQADKVLKDNVDLDKIADKLDLGPFKLAGSDAKVTLNDDNTVTLHANAKLPGLTASAPGLPVKDVSIGVDINADLQGQLKLKGLQLDVGEANLLGIHLKRFHLSYDSTVLKATGQITFDFLGNAGIDIKDFSITNAGKLTALVIDYLAGSGQGFPVGPGIFLIRVGGGFQAPDPVALHANAAVSMSPSLGKGCPTVGIDGTLDLHVSPAPLTVHAEGDPNLACIKIGSAIFDASSAGKADLTANLDLDVPAIVHVSGGIGGHIQTDPNLWQLDANGRADFKFLPVDAALKGVIGNLGIAACARFKIKTPWPFDDLVLAAGAGIRFPGGIPPITYPALVANFRAFTGCDLGSFSPIRAVRVGRASGAPMAFTLGTSPVAVSLEGAGATPHVTLVSPSGKRYDYTTGADDHGKFVDDSFGAVLPTEDRTVVMIHHPERGTWRAETAAGAAPVLRIQTAPVLPHPKVTGKVTGHGTHRVLQYKIKRIPGQSVSLVEEANGGIHVLRTVKNGGKGKVPYMVTEARSTKRTIAAQVNQDGMPRQRLAIAHYTAANPKVGRPRVHIRRTKAKALVTWSKAALATRYYVTVTYADGRTKLMTTDAKHRSVTVPAVGKKGGMRAAVTAYSASSRRGATGTARLKRVRPKHKAHRKPKRHHKHKRHKK